MQSCIPTSFKLFFAGVVALVDANVAAENVCKVTFCDDLLVSRGRGRYPHWGKNFCS
jgi:hypothetical protein